MTRSQLWDIGGQPRFRSMWERYCRGVQVIVYVVPRSLMISLFALGSMRASHCKGPHCDTASSRPPPLPPLPTSTLSPPPCRSYMVDAADTSKLESAKQELHALLEKPQLNGIPCLVLGNKNDLPNALGVEQLIEALYVTAIPDRVLRDATYPAGRVAVEGAVALLSLASWQAGSRLAGWQQAGRLSRPAHPIDVTRGLKSIADPREVCCYSISCKNQVNIGELPRSTYPPRGPPRFMNTQLARAACLAHPWPAA